MPLQGWTHSSHRSTPCFLSNNRAFSNGRQNSCTCPRARRHATAPRAQEQRVQRGYGQDDAADLEKLLGDSAGRMPKQLSARAQKQLQLLRSERNKPQDLRRTMQPSPSNGSSGQMLTNSSSNALHQGHLTNPVEHPTEVVVDSERLPTKAELKGTLGTVNRKVYELATQSRNRLSTKLSAANKQIRQLQKSAESHQQEVAAMHECMTRVMTELQTLSKVADAAATSAQFGIERKETVGKMVNLLDRMRVLQGVVQNHSRQLDQLRQRQIPVVWFGIAQEVKLMGSFDNWTQGFGLSAEEFSDGTFTKFKGVLALVPGRYEVKFLVDGQWRTAPDWPTVQTQHGVNNVLQID